MARDRHNGAGTVAGQDVVTNEDRDLLAVDRVGGVGAQEDTRLFLVLLTLEVGLRRDVEAVLLNGFLRVIVAVRPTRIDVVVIRNGGEEGIDKLMLWGEHHVLRAEEGVRAGGEDLDVMALRAEGDLGTAGAANPVALHGLDLVRPVEQFQIVEETIRVRRNAHHPLAQVLAEHREVATLRPAVRGDLLVREHRAQARAPVHGGVRQVDETELVHGLALFFRREVCVETAILGLALTDLELLDELGDGAGLLGLVIEPRVINLQEDPLRPLVELRIRGSDRAARIVAETQHAQLTAHVLNIGHRGGARVRTGLDGILLGRQAEGVITQRVQDVLAQHAVKASVSIRRDVAQRVADVQAHAGGIGEHVLDVELVLGQLALTS